MELVINTRGAKLSMLNNSLRVQTETTEQVLSANKLRSILINNAVNLSSNVLEWCANEGIDVVFAGRKGNPYGRFWSNKFGSISTIRRNQIAFCESERSMKFTAEIISDKIKNQALHLYTTASVAGKDLERIIQKLDSIADEVLKAPFDNNDIFWNKLQAKESSAAKLYFQELSQLLPEQYQFERRSQHPAKDMFNCLLNYGYGMLYGKIEGIMIKVGIDPFLGIMHRDDYNRPSLVYDIIEKYRVWVDAVVCHLCMEQVIFIEFFDVEEEVFWLNDYGKRILIQSVNDYMEEIITKKGVSRSRLQHLFLFLQDFAQTLKNFQS